MAVIEPIRSSRLYQGIVAQIQGLLERGQLKPGDRLPPERALAEQFGVSRASVREALRALELLGVVETRAGGGTFVRRPSPDELLRPLASLVRQGHSLQNVIELRGILEPEIAALAAQRITDGELAALHGVLAEQERRIAASEPYVREDLRFHDAVASAARNELLVTVLGVVRDVLRTTRDEWLQANTRPATSLDVHRRILAALAAHDSVAARAASAEHIRPVGEGMLQMLAARS